MSLQAFIAAFSLILSSEIFDKTQLAILAIAIRFKSPASVFLGALSAHALLDGIAILLGSLVASLASIILIKYVAGSLFVFTGAITLIKKESEKKVRETKTRNAFLASFAAIALSEFGDKTQFASALLGAANPFDALATFLGIVFALAIAIGLNVFIGAKLAKIIPAKTIRAVSGILFIAFGLATIIF